MSAHSTEPSGTGSLWIRHGGDVSDPVPSTGSSCTPSAVLYKGQVYVFHQGSNKNNELWYHVVRPNSDRKQAPTFSQDKHVPCGMSSGPSAVVEGDTLYVFHEGYNGSGELWYVTTTDGGHFSNDQRVENVGVSGGCGAALWEFSE